MDRQLIALKLALLRHGVPGIRKAGWVVGAVLVALTWVGAGLADGDRARHDVLALVFLLGGLSGALGPVMTSGAGVVRPEQLALLPLRGAVVARGLLVSAFVGVASAYGLLGLLAGVLHAALLSPAAVPVALVGAVLTWVLVVSVSRLVYGLLGAAMQSKVGIEVAGVQYGFLIASMFAGWMALQNVTSDVPRLLLRGVPDDVAAALDLSPTSWALLATEAAASGDVAGALLPLAGLLALGAAVVAGVVPLLRPRTEPARRRGGRGARSRAVVAGGGWLPATQTGAVVLKEVHQWRRDAWRALEVRTAVWAGVAVAVYAVVGREFASVAPFAGLVVAFMLGVAGLNLYGQDGTAVWQSVVGQDETSVRADVRGRQWAMLVVFLPQALVIAVLAVLLTRQWWVVPTLLAGFPALFGVATGAAVLVSALGVSPGVDPRLRRGPNDANGEVGLQLWIVLLIVPVLVLPTAAVAIAAAAQGTAPWAVLAVVVGVVNGVAGAWGLGRVAIGYLTAHLPDVYSRVRYGRVFPAEGAAEESGVLAEVVKATSAADDAAREKRRKEREDAASRPG